MIAMVKYLVNLEEAVIKREAMRISLGLRGAAVVRWGDSTRKLGDAAAELAALVCSSWRYKWPLHRRRYMHRKARASQSPMWNRLVTLPIDDREGLGGGGEGTSAKEENGGREWFSAADMTVDGGVAVGL